MDIKFSRHSKRRIKLYNIPERVIIKAVKNHGAKHKGKNEIIKNIKGFIYPIKIVYNL